MYLDADRPVPPEAARFEIVTGASAVDGAQIAREFHRHFATTAAHGTRA